MHVRIFSASLLTHSKFSMDNDKKLDVIQKEVNKFLNAHPFAEVEWLQSSSATVDQSITTLTAIVKCKE